MKRILLIYLTIASTCAFAQISVTKSEGSSVVTELGYGIKVNKGSTLKRERITLNDATCPIQLNDIGIETFYLDRSYSLKPSGTLNLKEAISALEIHFIIYDVFGEHIKTLSLTEVTDLEGQYDLTKTASWYASENTVSKYLICASYVANVRLKSGQIWHYDYDRIKEQLNILKIAFEQDYLPKKDTEK